MNFVPQIPCEDRGACAPSSSSERETRFDRLTGRRVGQEFAGRRARPPIRTIVRMPAPSPPHPEGVEGCQEQPQSVMFAKPDQIVPELYHRGLKSAAGLLEVSMLALAVFEHHAQARDAVPREHAQVMRHAIRMTPAEER